MFPPAIRAAFPAEFEAGFNRSAYLACSVADTSSRDSRVFEQLQHDPIAIETFNDSDLALSVLQGADLDNHLRMEADPTMREIIFSVSRRTQ